MTILNHQAHARHSEQPRTLRVLRCPVCRGPTSQPVCPECTAWHILLNHLASLREQLQAVRR